MKITNRCDMGCLYCHEGSTRHGFHGNVLNEELINSFHPYTEIAVGGGNPLCHPNLHEFLEALKCRNVLASMTVNQTHFMEDCGIADLVRNNLIRGLGVSLTNVTDEFIEMVKQYPNAVIHIINGITTMDDMRRLCGKGLKVLILGYKELRRGKDYHSPEIEKNKMTFYNNIKEIIAGFKVTSFDNLAIEQLNLRRLFTDEKWNEFYMGNDGDFTMYVDLVKQEFASSSTSKHRMRMTNDINEMFGLVRGET